MIPYATEEEYGQQAPNDVQHPDNLERLLIRATYMVRHATRHAIYSTTHTGVPTDRAVRDAMRDATISQVIAWAEADLAGHVLTGGATTTGVVASSSINGASVTMDHSEARAARARLLTGLGDEARLVLSTAGLLGGLPGIIR